MATIKFTPTPEAAPKSPDSRSIVAEPKSLDSRQPSAELLELQETTPTPEKKSKTYTDAQKRARDDWNKKQAQIAVRVPPETKSLFDEHCSSRGEKLVQFIIRACTNQIERDNESR